MCVASGVRVPPSTTASSYITMHHPTSPCSPLNDCESPPPLRRLFARAKFGVRHASVKGAPPSRAIAAFMRHLAWPLSKWYCPPGRRKQTRHCGKWVLRDCVEDFSQCKGYSARHFKVSHSEST